MGVAQTSPRAGSNAATAKAVPVLNLRLTVSDQLSGVSHRALIRETDAIWRDADLELRWFAGDVNQPEHALRVMVTPRVVSSKSGERWAVGELVRFEDSSAMALASIAGAERIVNESQAFQLIDLPAMREYRLGVVLGRAVAHEIGHYVLRTNTHAPYGLMRATIESKEFADLRTGSFRLDREALAHLAARSSRTAANDEFSYPSR